MDSRQNQKSSPNLRYSSRHAVDIHTLLISFMKDEYNDTRVLQNKLQDILTHHPDAFLKVSASGHTHFHDIIHLPFEFHRDKKKASDKAVVLFDVFSKLFADQKALSSSDKIMSCYKFLFTASNIDGFNPLHQIILTKNIKMLQAYLNLLLKGLQSRCISRDDIHTLFINQLTNSQDTPLHLAARLNDVSLLDELCHFYINRCKFSDESLIHTLAIKNKNGQPPFCTEPVCADYLHAIRSGDFNLVSNFLQTSKPKKPAEMKEDDFYKDAVYAENTSTLTNIDENKENIDPAGEFTNTSASSSSHAKIMQTSHKKVNKHKKKPMTKPVLHAKTVDDDKIQNAKYSCPSLSSMYSFFIEKLFGRDIPPASPDQKSSLKKRQ